MESERGGKEEEGVAQQNPVKGTPVKLCKGCLYYSSILKSNGRNPVCVGVGSTPKQQVPGSLVGKIEMEASKAGRGLSDFRYACVGYSVYLDKKDNPTEQREKQAELPFCFGIELVVDKRAATSDHVPAHAHNREEGQVSSQPRTYKPPHSVRGGILEQVYKERQFGGFRCGPKHAKSGKLYQRQCR